ncbi:hypothetical protein PF005_g23769 [Phytophthora fragariae]|uniref:Uncharacterized protein n=1 Tax=Phytophthora fragariae TaxID=53985 RepID=A0A6A3KN96_9STRA|nr:hypothetical protein PF011_g11233 [Phytophthora fragariae]KAE9179215.1 hypothetical protein PF005_g23769 [Phytophthora fragariae]KAE9188898.1 hypothetical protein PF002_g25190 [Phytophthora fragariae]
MLYGQSTIWHADWSSGNDIPRALLQEHKIRNRPPPSRPDRREDGLRKSTAARWAEM